MSSGDCEQCWLLDEETGAPILDEENGEPLLDEDCDCEDEAIPGAGAGRPMAYWWHHEQMDRLLAAIERVEEIIEEVKDEPTQGVVAKVRKEVAPFIKTGLIEMIKPVVPVADQPEDAKEQLQRMRMVLSAIEAEIRAFAEDEDDVLSLLLH